MSTNVTSLELAKVAAVAVDDKKASDIQLLDLTQVSDMSDYFLICTAANKPMMDAIVEEVQERVRLNCAEKPLTVEGRDGSNWVLVDYGSVVVHVFREESRSFYRLESLWGDAPHVALDLEGATPQDQWLHTGEDRTGGILDEE